MNISIGIDCEEIKRFQNILDKPKLVDRIFTKKELEYCNKKANPKQHLAVRFSGKEALIKAFSDQGIRINMSDIEILNDPQGVPHASVKGVEGYIIKISLSHTEGMVVAQALVINQSSENDI